MRFARLSVLTTSVIVALALAGQVQAGPITYGPTPYLSAADSPFAGGAGLDYFYLEDFEDFALNTPGVTASAGYSTKPAWPASATDSVDGDDGVIDGYGNNGNSWFSSPGPAGVTFTFDAGVLGALPIEAGIVWTDGMDPITFEAYDAYGALIGSISTTGVADPVYTGTTAEDRFFGISYPDGIGKIKLYSGPAGVASGIEMDHLQYGGNTIPAPGAVILAGIGAGVAGWLRRRGII